MAWHFDETNDEVQITDHAALTLPDADWTIAGWLKLDDNVGNIFQYFLSWGTTSAQPNINWFFPETDAGLDNDQLKLVMLDSDGDGFPAGAIVGASSPGLRTDWMHLAVVRTGAGVITQYIDGAADGTATDATFDAVNRAGNFHFGCRSDFSATRYFGGDLAEWAKWDRALSADELLGLAAGFTPDHYPTPAWHVPMWGNQYHELRVPLTVTNDGSTAIDHPGGLIYPSRSTLFLPTGEAPAPGVDELFAANQLQGVLHNPALPVPVPY